MSSQLFQKIREEKGLVYSIYSYPSSYTNAGFYTIYAGMKPENLDLVISLIMEEVKDFKSKGITQDQLLKSKEQLKGNFILGLESTSSRMNSIGKSELMLGRIYSPDEIIKNIDNITLENSLELIQDIFSTDKMSFAAVGNIKRDFEINELKKILL